MESSRPTTMGEWCGVECSSGMGRNSARPLTGGGKIMYENHRAMENPETARTNETMCNPKDKPRRSCAHCFIITKFRYKAPQINIQMRAIKRQLSINNIAIARILNPRWANATMENKHDISVKIIPISENARAVRTLCAQSKFIMSSVLSLVTHDSSDVMEDTHTLHSPRRYVYVLLCLDSA